MRNKGHFFGKYYKITNLDNHSLAFITYVANNKRGLMLLTNDKSYDLDTSDIKVNGKDIIFNVLIWDICYAFTFIFFAEKNIYFR